MKKIIILFSLAFSLAGCEKVYDSSYYKENPEKAKATLQECKSGKVSGENCDNASKGYDSYKAAAFKDYMMGKRKDLPKFD